MTYKETTKPTNVFGYFIESARYGSFTSECLSWTNGSVHWASRDHPESSDPASKWIPTLVKSIQKTYDAKRLIHLEANLQNGTENDSFTPLTNFFRAMVPFKDRIVSCSIADEPKWTAHQTNTHVDTVRSVMKGFGMNFPLGICYSVQQWPKARPNVDRLDQVLIEAYSATAEGYEESNLNTGELREYLRIAKNAVPITKDIILVAQTYARGGFWNKINEKPKGTAPYKAAVQNMCDLLPTIYEAAQDKRVQSVLCFSYGREWGARQFPILTSAVKQFGKALLDYKSEPTIPPTPQPETPHHDEPRRDRDTPDRGK